MLLPAVGSLQQESPGQRRVGSQPQRGARTVKPNALYLVIGVLAVVAAAVGYQLYQERQKTHSVQISIDKGGVSIEKK